MRILFINSYYFMPQSRGGLARTLDQLAGGLRARGHDVVGLVEFRNDRDVFSMTRRVRLKLARSLRGSASIIDRHEGWKLLRCWRVEDVVAQVVRSERPDVVVLTGGRIVPIVRKLRGCGVPVVLQLHDVEFEYLAGDFSEVADLPCIANSQFTARRYRESFGAECEVILPFIRLEDYVVDTPGDRVLFVHPVEKKGVAKAVALVQACPEIPFTFVGRSSYMACRDDLGLPDPDELPNLELLPNLHDMREAYRRARLLIVPSRWEEAYGRVVSEAQVSGIPAIVSARGGLPEAVGEAGLVLPHEAGANVWAENLRDLWTDPEALGRLSALAKKTAARPELSKEYQLDRHEAVLTAAAEQARGFKQPA